MSAQPQYVTVLRGELLGDAFLDCPLFDEATGERVRGDYRGKAYLFPKQLVIGNPAEDVYLQRYVIGEPSDEAWQKHGGFLLGQSQKRCLWPNGKPEAFVDGWKVAWRERDPKALKDFMIDPKTGKTIRWSSYQAKRKRG